MKASPALLLAVALAIASAGGAMAAITNVVTAKPAAAAPAATTTTATAAPVDPRIQQLTAQLYGAMGAAIKEAAVKYGSPELAAKIKAQPAATAVPAPAAAEPTEAVTEPATATKLGAAAAKPDTAKPLAAIPTIPEPKVTSSAGRLPDDDEILMAKYAPEVAEGAAERLAAERAALEAAKDAAKAPSRPEPPKVPVNVYLPGLLNVKVRLNIWCIFSGCFHR